jgi:hypothetical protein
MLLADIDSLGNNKSDEAIFVNFMISTDFVIYCHFVELFVCNFSQRLKVGHRVWPKSKISHITPVINKLTINKYIFSLSLNVFF